MRHLADTGRQDNPKKITPDRNQTFTQWGIAEVAS